MKYILASALVCLLFSCQEPAEITVQNRLPNGKLLNVRWGDLLLATELLPGQTSVNEEIYSNNNLVDLPDVNAVSFTLESNGSKIFLETVETFALDVEEQQRIIIDTATQVTNVLVNLE
jgi:hypothetical protein